VAWQVKFEDNQDILDMIEAKPHGLLPKLDDVCSAPGGSDKAYVEGVTAKFKDAPKYKDVPRFKARPRDKVVTSDGSPVSQDMLFGINHYAGPVIYNATSA
jgi:myosin heavy subunit